MKRHVVLGTAGHIDHGKTTIIKALTGMDTDWLQEEKERGMTIDLGFAFLGDHITIIDVPGHERFVRNMVSGVSTIDIVLFVIAADDGIMPQTTEHLEILDLLQIQHGIIIISKIDLVEDEWLELVEDEIQNLVQNTVLQNAPIVHVSGTTGKGIEKLKQLIYEMTERLPPRQDKGIFRLPIDRVFTMRGFGTVVAGTVLSGILSVDDTVELLPQQKKLRVRGLQIHQNNVKRVKLGDRAAINLAGIEREAIKRGNVLAQPDFYTPTQFYDAKLYLLKDAGKPLEHNARVRLHLGTDEVMARIALLDSEELRPGNSTFIQLRCEKPVAAEVRDRFVIRSYSPIITIGGGVILQIKPKRHKRYSEDILRHLEILEKGDMLDLIEQTLAQGKNYLKGIDEISKIASLSNTDAQTFLDDLVKKGKAVLISQQKNNFYIHRQHCDRIKESILNRLTQFHAKNPLRQGISTSELRILIEDTQDQVLINRLLKILEDEGKIIIDNGKIRLASYQISLTKIQVQVKQQIEKKFLDSKFSPPKTTEIISQFKQVNLDIETIIAYLVEIEQLIKVDEGILIHRKWMEEAQQLILEHFKHKNELTVSEFRNIINTSRKYAVPILGYFDQNGLTVRQEDIRILNEQFIHSYNGIKFAKKMRQ